jgi:Xaa-Pro aminopeptidase
MLSRSDECQQKYQAVVRHLQAHGLEAAVITRRNNFAWFTCGGRNHVGLMSEVGAASLLITPEKVLCITNNIEAGRIIAEELEGLKIEVRAHDWWDAAGAAHIWAAELSHRLAAADEPVAAIGRALPPLGPEFDALRYQLNEAEIARFRSAALDAGMATEAACRRVRPGMTEHELAALMAIELNSRDLRVSVALVANEERVRRFRHPIPTSAKITKFGMAVTGAERHGMFVSLTRLFTFGPIGDDLRRRHEAVCAVDAAMIAATRPGATLGEIFALCQQTYAAGGFADDWKLHHQGGLTGYRPRENFATPGCPVRVHANQAYAWNPSITGTKSEDTILVLPDRNEIISATGQWPTKLYTAGGQTWLRNEILVL